jgi:hypothetical protein
VLRVHDVKSMGQVVRMTTAICDEKIAD